MASIKDIEKVVESQEEVVDITIRDPSGEPYRAKDGSPATIGVVGSESKTYKAAAALEARRMRNAALSGLDDEARARSRVNRAVAAVKRWHGWDDGKKELDCTPENVRALLSAPAAEHILDQVERGVHGHALFSGSGSSD